MLNINVRNLRDTKEGIRCDRSSLLGNPFHMQSEASRLLVIQAFGEYLNAVAIKQKDPAVIVRLIAQKHSLDVSSSWKRPSRRQFIAELNRVYNLALVEEISLLCWCAPLACHCDMLKRYFIYYETTKDNH